MKILGSGLGKPPAPARRPDWGDCSYATQQRSPVRWTMYQVFGCCFLGIMLVAPAAHGQSTGTSTQTGTGSVDAAQVSAAATQQAPPAAEHTNFRLEVGGFYSPFVPGPGSQNWREGEFRLTFTGSKRIVPFGGMSRISNGDGSQLAYGVGSYVIFHPHFYVIAGFSAAQDTEVQFSPRRRYDVAGYLAVPRVNGLVFSAGWTELSGFRNSTAGRIIALGNMYYWRKFVFSGNVNLNFVEPTNEHSVSGQFTVLYGMQHRYYISGGMSGGGAAYMLITGAPFLVRYQTIGTFGMFTKWFNRHAGINFRYDYQRFIAENLQRHWIRAGLIFEF